MKNYFIIHGSFGSPYSNWTPWLAGEIEKTKPAEKEESICYVPHMPTGVGLQNYQNWENVMKSYLLKDELLGIDTTIFAHSIAPAFVCKFLITNKIKVKRLVFVCGFNNYFGVNEAYDAVNESMYIANIEEIKKYCNEIICFYSDNDPYVDFAAEKDFADKVGSKQILVEGGGHLNKASGFETFTQLKEYI